MQAGKNRKRDLTLLTEVYSSHLLGEGLKDYDPAQQQGGSQQARMAPNMGTETHTGYVQAGLDKDPLLNPEGESEETYEGEEETLQERSGRMLTRQGWKKGEVTPKGNWVYTKADQPDAHVGTDGLINGNDPKQFLNTTGKKPGTENEENDQSLPEPEDTGVNADENRGSWGSAAFGNEDHEMLVGRPAGCGAQEREHGSSDPTHNPHALGGMVSIIAKAIADQHEDDEDQEDDDDLLQKHMDKVHGPDTDDFDERYFKKLDPEQWKKAKEAGWDPDENAEDGAAAAMRADERENRKNLSAQDVVAKIYGFNPDENQEELPWPKEIDDDEDFDDFEGTPDTDKADEKHFKAINPEQWAKAKQAGWSSGATEDEEYDEDEVDREKRYKDRWGKNLDDERGRKGSSSAGAYTDVDKKKFCGPSGGAADGTFPVNTRKRAIAAKSYAHNAPDPAGIDKCVARKWPDLDKDEKKESYFKSKGDKAMTQLMESYQTIVNHNHGPIL